MIHFFDGEEAEEVEVEVVADDEEVTEEEETAY